MRMRTFLPLLLFVVTALAGIPRFLTAQQSGIAVGSDAPDARVFTLDGEPVQLASLFGEEPAIIEFWATWCPLCRALEPQFAELAIVHRDQLQVIRVGVRDNQTAERQKEYVSRRGLTSLHLFDRDGAATRAFMVPHTSYVVVIDASGEVVYTGQGKDQDLAKAVSSVVSDMSSR